MKKIVIITSQIFGNSSANGIIALKLANYLSRKGYLVSTISYNNLSKRIRKTENITHYFVNKPFFTIVLQSKNKLFIFLIVTLRRLLNIFLFFLFPVFNLIYVLKVYKTLLSINLKSKIDLIIPISKPFENFSAARKYSKVQGTPIITYLLDMPKSIKRPFLFPIFIYNYYLEKFFKTILLSSNYTIVPYYSKIKNLPNNVLSLDFPTYLSSKKIDKIISFEFSPNYFNFIYAGMINSSDRDPNYLIRFLSKLNLSKKIRIYLFSSNKIVQPISTLKKIEIIQPGLVNQDILFKYYKGCDFLINFINSKNEVIPSKLGELISFKKPIINVSNYKTPYHFLKPYKNLMKFSSTFFIDLSDVHQNQEKIIAFIKSSKNSSAKTISSKNNNHGKINDMTDKILSSIEIKINEVFNPVP